MAPRRHCLWRINSHRRNCTAFYRSASNCCPPTRLRSRSCAATPTPPAATAAASPAPPTRHRAARSGLCSVVQPARFYHTVDISTRWTTTLWTTTTTIPQRLRPTAGCSTLEPILRPTVGCWSHQRCLFRNRRRLCRDRAPTKLPTAAPCPTAQARGGHQLNRALPRRTRLRPGYQPHRQPQPPHAPAFAVRAARYTLGKVSLCLCKLPYPPMMTSLTPREKDKRSASAPWRVFASL